MHKEQYFHQACLMYGAYVTKPLLNTELFAEETMITSTEETHEEAAVKIQAAFRGMQARQKVKVLKEEQVGAAFHY